MFDMDGNRIDNLEDYKGEYVNMCEGVKDMLRNKEDKDFAVIRAIRGGMTDNDIRDNYGVDQDVINRARAALQD